MDYDRSMSRAYHVTLVIILIVFKEANWLLTGKGVHPDSRCLGEGLYLIFMMLLPLQSLSSSIF